MSGNSKTVAFFGASTGIGLSALKHTLATGHQCIALCRVPSKLEAALPAATYPNLKIVQGNAHDLASVSKCLQGEDGRLVDSIVSTIGARFSTSKMGLDDPEVCGKGVSTLLGALAELRRSGTTGTPHIIVCSSTGLSHFGRDIPLAIVPLYRFMLKVPHKDKVVMEARLVASEEAYTIVRPSFLTNGESNREIRVGIEDPKAGRESTAVGYTISREDAGKWIAENTVLKRDVKFYNKIAMITY